MSLIIRDLSITYSNGVKAVDNLSLEIKPGMFGLLGPNGAGKSSLMRTIATLQLPDRGTLTFNSIDICRTPLQLRKVLGYLPQSFGVYPNVSGERLLGYFAMLKGVALKKERNRLVAEILDLVNLYDVRKKSVSGYSGGMKQRFGIAQILLNNPKLIIVDEPTAGLDPAERNRFLNVLREIGTQNTVIFSTHIVDDVKELCTEMAIMHNGRILKKDTPANTTAALVGKIWTAIIDREDLTQLEEKYNLLSSSYNEDNTLTARIYAKGNMHEIFNPAKPNLEDAYFIALKSTVQA